MLFPFRASASALAFLLVSGCGLVHGTASHAQPTPPLAGVEIVSRAEWSAAAPTMSMAPQTPSALTIHHTAVVQRPDLAPEAKMRALQAFSVSSDTLGDGRAKAPWADVPYHFYVASDGTILEGRSVYAEGDTNTGYDLHGMVQIVLEGNFMEEAPGPAQVRSLLALARALAARYGMGPETVTGHRDHPGRVETLCPGDALEALLPDVRAAVASARG